MNNTIIKTAVSLVMNKKVRTTVKIISGVLWVAEKGIDMYEGYADKMDQELLIGKLVEESLKDETGIKKMAKEEAKRQVSKEMEQVRKDIAEAMAKSGTQNDKINKFLKSLPA